MYKLIITVLLLAIVIVGKSQVLAVHHHNRIDDIKAAKQIKQIIDSLLGEDNEKYDVDKDLHFKEKANKELAAKLKIVPWVKVDFDNNGYTDLLVIEKYNGKQFDEDSRSVICIMDSGDNHFLIKRITRRSFQYPVFPVVKTIDNVPSILYFYPEVDFMAKWPIYINDTLVFKFGDFVEYNQTRKNYDIEKVEYELKPSYMFGKAPSTFISLNKDHSATSNRRILGGKTELKAEGLFTTIIDTPNYRQVIDLLNYIDFVNLKDEYSVGWTDDRTCVLTITYSDGKIKRIRDYGRLGSFGLNNLYNILSNLRLNQNWK